MARRGVVGIVVTIGIIASFDAVPTYSAPADLTTAAAASNIALRLDPPPRTFSLLATGDVLTESPVTLAAAAVAGPGVRYDFVPLLAPIAPIISSADIAICHMEMPIGLPGERDGVYGRSPFGGNLILAPYEIATSLARVGFDRCSTASNHSNDVGIGGIESTLAALDAAGISHSGTARTPAESAITVMTINGVRFAHLAYTRYSNTTIPADPWRLNFAASPEQVAADVRAARAAGADVVVVSLHLSKELLTEPTPEDRQFVTDLTAQAHVDLVVEHGPHVMQPLERVNGTWVYWSVGNLISGMGTASRGKYADPRTLDGIAAGARFTETSPGVFDVQPWPVLLCVDVFSRQVFAPLSPNGQQFPPIVQSEMDACARRSLAVVPSLH